MDELKDIKGDLDTENKALRKLKNKIRNNHLIYPTNIEGKGEYENDGVRITSLDGEEVLYEDNIL